MGLSWIRVFSDFVWYFIEANSKKKSASVNVEGWNGFRRFRGMKHVFTRDHCQDSKHSLPKVLLWGIWKSSKKKPRERKKRSETLCSSKVLIERVAPNLSKELVFQDESLGDSIPKLYHHLWIFLTPSIASKKQQKLGISLRQRGILHDFRPEVLPSTVRCLEIRDEDLDRLNPTEFHDFRCIYSRILTGAPSIFLTNLQRICRKFALDVNLLRLRLLLPWSCSS